MSKNLTRQRVATFLTHLLCIIILILLPEIISSLTGPHHPPKPWVYAKAVVFIGAFYINYYLIIEHSLDKPRGILRLLGYNVIVCAVSLFFIYLIWHFGSDLGEQQPPIHHHRHHPPEGLRLPKNIGIFSRDLVMIIFVIGFAIALRMSQKWLTLERRQQDLINAQREEELKNLKSQLNPHFLFNTLNSIYALTAISSDKAQIAIHELSQLLRYILYDTSETVPLHREVSFVENYISLMKLRLNPTIKLDVNLDKDNDDNRLIAPLLFITLIENVFKHGIHTPEIPISISITINDDCITCRTSNGIATDSTSLTKPSSSTNHDKGGIGLANLHRRIDLIYGANARLDVKTTDQLYIVTLTIKSLKFTHSS